MELMKNAELRMNEFEDSANFAFGISVGEIEVSEIDILNNPYVEFKGVLFSFWALDY